MDKQLKPNKKRPIAYALRESTIKRIAEEAESLGITRSKYVQIIFDKHFSREDQNADDKENMQAGEKEHGKSSGYYDT